MAPQKYTPLSLRWAATMLMWNSCPLGSGVTRKRRSRLGWLRSSGKAASLSIWLLGLLRYQLRTKRSGLLEKLQVKVAFAPSGTTSRAGEKVRALQGPLAYKVPEAGLGQPARIQGSDRKSVV